MYAYSLRMTKRKTLPWTGHDCCGSRVRNRHLTNCETRVPTERALPSDLQIRIWSLKHIGYNSGQVYDELSIEYPDLTLAQVNKLYV